MAFTALNRLKIRRRVQGLLRDEGYPVEAINEALERVFTYINNSGRYRFQENTYDFTIATGTYQYTFAAGTSFLGEIDVIFNPQAGTIGSPGISDGSWALHKMNFEDALAEGRFSTSASSGPPQIYCLPGPGTVLWLDPLPDSGSNGKTLRVFGYLDMTPPASDIAAITVLPARYHSTLLVYGTLAEIAPALQVSSADGFISASAAFSQAFKAFQLQEKWEPHLPIKLLRDARWRGVSRRMGKVEGRVME